MLYSAVITDICSQLGDPDGNEYGERAKDHFANAISQLVMAGDFNPGELFYYEKMSGDLEFSTQPVDISDLKAIYIKNITAPLDALMAQGNRYEVKLISIEEAQGIVTNPDRQPEEWEVFVYRYGDYLRYIRSSDSNFNPTADSLWVYYIEDIDNSEWVDGTDLEEYFKVSFIRKCITIAVQTLKQEDSLNN